MRAAATGCFAKPGFSEGEKPDNGNCDTAICRLSLVSNLSLGAAGGNGDELFTGQKYVIGIAIALTTRKSIALRLAILRTIIIGGACHPGSDD